MPLLFQPGLGWKRSGIFHALSRRWGRNPVGAVHKGGEGGHLPDTSVPEGVLRALVSGLVPADLPVFNG